jgi:sulfur-carrier protein
MRVSVQYFALLREERGLNDEVVETTARTAEDLYLSLRARHNFRLPVEMVKVSINDRFSDMRAELGEGDRIVFIPPVAGG